MQAARTLSLCLVCLLGCATLSPPAARFLVECKHPDAMVFIDEVLVGRVADWSKPGNKMIRAGFHRVEIRQLDHHSHFSEIDAHPGAAVVVKAELYPHLE
jgi:hypothetical protein